MNLRNYQEQLVNGLAGKLARGKRKVVGQLATGGGKTVVFSAITKRYIQKANKRVLILVHRKELLKQTRNTAFNAFGIICQPIIAGMKYIPPADLYVGMVESVNRRIDKLEGIGLVIIDECHRLEFIKLHQHFPKEFIVGFTATPLTASKKKPLKDYYEDIVCGVDIPQLIKEGHLCQNITWAPKDTVDRIELAVKNGEFDEQYMAQEFSKTKYVNNTVSAYTKWASGTKAIIFNVNIDHSKVVNEAFIVAGYPAKHLDSEMSSTERDRILEWFKSTPNAILNNVGIATTGFDEPTIETVIVNKATLAMPLWLQMCGRGSRTHGSKNMFTIIDMGGNAISHGDWCQSRNWEAIFFEPPKPGKPTSAPVKSCPQCDAIIPASAKVCQYCGYIYPAKSVALEVELHEFVVVTKGIDVAALVEQNKHRKQFYPFFKIGEDLAADAKKTIPTMCDDYATFILQKYFELAKEWTKTQHKKFNQWLQEKAKEHLFEKLELLYPEWGKDTKLIQRSHAHPANLEVLEKLEPIKDLK